MYEGTKRKEVEELFLKQGFSTDDFVVGVGKTFSKKGKEKRFEFNARERKPILCHTARYVVKYFSDFDFYIIWKTRQKTTPGRVVFRSVFSLKADDAFEAFKLNSVAHKGVEFEWRLAENVNVVNAEDLKKIVERLPVEG